MRFESQLSRMYCQMFSTGLSSGHFGGFGIAGGQDQSHALALFRADGAEDIGRCGSLIPRSARASAALRPPAGDLVLLADTSLVLEPNFYLADIDRLFARDFIQARWELFLKSSMAPSACA